MDGLFACGLSGLFIHFFLVVILTTFPTQFCFVSKRLFQDVSFCFIFASCAPFL